MVRPWPIFNKNWYDYYYSSHSNRKGNAFGYSAFIKNLNILEDIYFLSLQSKSEIDSALLDVLIFHQMLMRMRLVQCKQSKNVPFFGVHS